MSAFLHLRNVLVSVGMILGASCAQKEEEPLEIYMEANENFEFVPNEFSVNRGQPVHLVFYNKAMQANTEIKHNLVVIRPDVEVDQMLSLGLEEEGSNYIPESYQSVIVFQSDMLVPNSEERISFNAPLLKGRYPFICTFPGHCGLGMKGIMNVK